MSKIDAVALRAVAETLENLAFMEALPAHEESPGNGLGLTAALLVHEPQQGEVRISLPSALLEKISRNLFGHPAEGVAVPDPKDLLAELLNTIAGRFLTELLPPEQPFRIGLPELDPPPTFAEEACSVWHFRADEHLFTLSVSNLESIYPS